MLKEITFESIISPFQKIISILFISLMISMIWYADYFLEKEHEFLLFFFMSLCFFFACYPWTQKKKVTISDNNIYFFEILGPLMDKKEESIDINKIISLRLTSYGFDIIHRMGTYQIRAEAFKVKKLSGIEEEFRKGEVISASRLKEYIRVKKSKLTSL